MIAIHEDEDPIRIVMDSGRNTFSVEYTASIVVRHIRGETDGHFTAAYVSFTHQPDDVAEFESLLGSTVRASATWSGLAVSRDTWHLPLRRRDPVLRDLLGRQAEEARNSAPGTDDLLTEVQRTIARRIGSDISIQGVARDLITTPRTLQRRLAPAGASYETLRDDVRRETAERCLAEGKLSSER